MANTPTPIVWDFKRNVGVDPNAKLGGVVHYFDEQAQTIFLNQGMKTKTSTPLKGQWETSPLGPNINIDDIPYTDLGIDHPSTGVLYFSAVKPDGTVEFIRYQYAMDLSDITDNATYTSQIDNPITQITATIGNIDAELFQSTSSIFSPGAKLTLGIAMGNSDVYPLGIAWVDESPFNPLQNTVQLSGRNSIGYFIKESTFGDTTEFTGTFPEICTLMFELSGVPKYSCADGVGLATYKFSANDTILSGFTHMNNVVYYYPTNPMLLQELPDGTVVNQYAEWFDSTIPNTYYIFDDKKEVFARNMKKNIDAVYYSVYVTGKAEDGTDLIPVIVKINNYNYWHTPKNKMLHISAPDTFVKTQLELQAYAETEAKRRQFSGISEDFTSPIRPQLLTGDVASVKRDGSSETIGVVTQVKHTMGKRGFTTSFSTSSGGEIEVVQGGVIVNATGERGYNRKQNLTDIMSIVSTK